jgi:hypothetical protein
MSARAMKPAGVAVGTLRVRVATPRPPNIEWER